MENVIVAFTNFPVILPLETAWKNNDITSFFVILFVGVASIVSHLAENHKHGMPGLFTISKSRSYLLNRLDVMGVYITLLRFLYLYFTKFGLSTQFIILNYKLCCALICSFMLNIISEYDKTQNTKNIFIVTHSLWHIFIFILMDKFYLQLM